jgi:cytochrome c-type biogenesis protein CcmH
LLAFALLVLTVLVLAGAAGAVEPNEVLDDPMLEARARVISKDLRCLVCQNQSIDDSDAELAGDLRVLVRERLKAGDTNQQVIDYVVSRYGDFVLLKPPFKLSTYALWLGPAAIVLIGAIAVFVFYRRRSVTSDTMSQTPLSDAERQRLSRLFEDDHR